jgi:DnaJ-class molecular chaperone
MASAKVKQEKATESLDETMTAKVCKRCNGTGVIKSKRRLTPYNKFFQEKMKTPQIKALPHNQRMKAIAVMWKAQKAK